MLKNKRRIAILIVALMLVMAFSTTGFASWLDKTVKASYRNITVFVNGVQKQALTETGTAVEPFIVDGTTYVPLRGIASMLGYQVSFNPSTYRIDLQGTDVQALAAQVVQKEARIKELETLLAKYGASTEVVDLEKDLNKDYTKIGTLGIEDIKLKGDSKSIELQVFVDLTKDKDYDAWDKLSDTTKKRVLQSMVDDILDEYSKATVTGFVQDNYDKAKLLKFSLDRSGKVVFGSGSSSSRSDLLDLEDELNYRLDRIYYSSSGYVEVDVVVDGDEDDISVVIDAAYRDFRELDTEDIEDYLEDVYDEVQYWFKDASVSGKFTDGRTDLATFTFTTKGRLNLRIK
ncbi:MAG: stalk domain-containing protein [Gudongella sp.]|jgi:hypothetical protein|nr:stalk domain-containing protein [Gudongella sp.]